MLETSPALVETTQALRAAQDERDTAITKSYLRLALTRRKDHLAISEEGLAAFTDFVPAMENLPLIEMADLTAQLEDVTHHIGQAMRALTDAIARLSEETR